MRKLTVLTLVLLFITTSYAQEISLKKGLTITKSVKVRKGTYKLDASTNLDKPVIVIEGDNITIDFNHAVLKGSNLKTQPDDFFGVGILVKKGKNITIKNLSARGYKVALMGKGIDGLKIENCDFSYNYRQHLNSTQEKEDISDWLSHHRNDKDEWLRYGSAIYLRGCNNAIISNNKVTGGQNALMITDCNNGMIYNNDFSFNSGLGLGMYNSSMNKIMYNKMNFNVRGYSHGVYNRGQDSAGILIYEQSSSNLFYKNSVTHGGDGFFLWAGQTTMDKGTGGCNDNILLDNDFSYAPTNGIEATFSRNYFIHNRVFECDHGIWGGYSYDSQIKSNQFRDNRIAIAIEHGQNIDIDHNLFSKDKESIRLWGRKEQPADWVYAQKRDTRSRNYNIVGNSFNNEPVVFNLNRTDSLNIFDNIYSNCDLVFKIDSTVTHLDTLGTDELAYRLSKDSIVNIHEVKNPMDPFKADAKLAGRKNILVTEWGPYDYRYPFIWNTNPMDTTGKMEFDVLGPKGEWKIISAKGIDMPAGQKGTFPAKLTVQKQKAGRTDVEIVAQYTGASFTDQFGNTVGGSKPFTFSFRKFFQPIDYTVKFYAFDSTNNPIKSSTLTTLVKQEPFKTEKVNKLDYAWWGGIRAGNKQYPQFLTIAEGKADFLPGTYEVGITWDDAVRVYVDGKLVFDEWNPSKYVFDESPNKKIRLNLAGQHAIRVEHVELGGFATLSVKFKKV